MQLELLESLSYIVLKKHSSTWQISQVFFVVLTETLCQSQGAFHRPSLQGSFGLSYWLTDSHITEADDA